MTLLALLMACRLLGTKPLFEPMQLVKQLWMKIGFQYNNFHTGNNIWKCRLQMTTILRGPPVLNNEPGEPICRHIFVVKLLSISWNRLRHDITHLHRNETTLHRVASLSCRDICVQRVNLVQCVSTQIENSKAE